MKTIKHFDLDVQGEWNSDSMKEFEDSSRNLNYLAKLKQGKSRVLGLHLLWFIHLQRIFLRIMSVIWYIYHHFKYCSEFTKIHCQHKNMLIGLCKTRWILLIWLSSFFIFGSDDYRMQFYWIYSSIFWWFNY